MIYVNYSTTTGEIIDAYHESCVDIPKPNIMVTDEDWSTAQRYRTRKVDLETLTLTYDHTEADRQIAAKRIREIDSEITTIETAQTRQLREITLGLDTSGAAREKLESSDSAIAALRAERATLAISIA